MNAKARNLDIFKTIVLLYCVAFIFFRFIYSISPQGGLAAPQSPPASQPAATLKTVPTIVPIPSPVPIESAAVTAAAAAIPAASAIPVCPLSAPARISGVGARVRVTNALIPLRSKPAVPSSSFLGPLPIGTELEVISLPVCEPYLEGANLWWQVRTLSGKTGWAAEASALKPAYYYLQQIN